MTSPHELSAGVPTIGLLAGMGVRSTGPFLDLIISECQRQYGAENELDYPPMIVFSWPTPFTFEVPLDDGAMQRTVGRGLQWLESTGVDFIAMPCNAAHVYYEPLSAEVGVPFLNLIDEAVDSVPSGLSPLALMATRSTRDSGLYQRRLQARGVEVHADEDVQERLDGLLQDIRRVADLDPLRAEWRSILELVRRRGAGAALVACTDLNAVMGDDPPLPLVDGTRALAARIVSTWLEMRDRGA